MNNLFRIALILLAGYVIYLIFKSMNKDKPIQNEGNVSVNVDGSSAQYAQQYRDENPRVEYAREFRGASPAIATSGCPKLAQIGSPKVTLNSQLDTIDDCNYQNMKNNTNVLPYPQISNNYAPQLDVSQTPSVTSEHQQYAPSCFPKDQLTAEELLPREDGYNTWQEVNPQSQGALTDQNFLESGHHFGINTVNQSLKNPNKQLRSDPVIPQVPVGPWQNSTYEPDTNRRFFEIGQC